MNLFSGCWPPCWTTHTHCHTPAVSPRRPKQWFPHTWPGNWSWNWGAWYPTSGGAGGWGQNYTPHGWSMTPGPTPAAVFASPSPGPAFPATPYPTPATPFATGLALPGHAHFPTQASPAAWAPSPFLAPQWQIPPTTPVYPVPQPTVAEPDPEPFHFRPLDRIPDDEWASGIRRRRTARAAARSSRRRRSRTRDASVHVHWADGRPRTVDDDSDDDASEPEPFPIHGSTTTPQSFTSYAIPPQPLLQQPSPYPANTGIYLNPHLSDAYLRWNITNFPSTATLHGTSASAALGEQATYPPTTQLTITFASDPRLAQWQQLWGPIRVRARGAYARFITVEDVLTAIHSYFRVPNTSMSRAYFRAGEWEAASEMFYRRVADARRGRAVDLPSVVQARVQPSESRIQPKVRPPTRADLDDLRCHVKSSFVFTPTTMPLDTAIGSAARNAAGMHPSLQSSLRTRAFKPERSSGTRRTGATQSTASTIPHDNL
uniref:DUF6699 domain-containing protein n=1 Tax=Mycena chlorophos TaxID=658473 RepID=A0ABQ0LD11_MYCCL|nr:predicted protein [Mycena chlorophos]